MDIVANGGLRGIIHVISSPRESVESANNHPVKGQRQYVRVRRKDQDGRKGRVSIYRVSQAGTDKCGRRLTQYQRVEDGYIASKDEVTFTTVEKSNHLENRRSVKLQEDRSPKEPEKHQRQKRRGVTSKQDHNPRPTIIRQAATNITLHKQRHAHARSQSKSQGAMETTGARQPRNTGYTSQPSVPFLEPAQLRDT